MRENVYISIHTYNVIIMKFRCTYLLIYNNNNKNAFIHILRYMACFSVLHIRWESMGVICFFYVLSAAYPAVYGQFPQAIPQPMSAVAPAQREGKAQKIPQQKKKKTSNKSTQYKNQKKKIEKRKSNRQKDK